MLLVFMWILLLHSLHSNLIVHLKRILYVIVFLKIKLQIITAAIVHDAKP